MRTRTRSRKSRTRKQRKNNVFRKIRKTTVKVLPVLRNVGEIVVVKTAPVVNKGLDGLYGTLATGFDMGVKGVQKGIKMRKSQRTRTRTRK
jgi:hypothetical protein